MLIPGIPALNLARLLSRSATLIGSVTVILSGWRTHAQANISVTEYSPYVTRSMLFRLDFFFSKKRQLEIPWVRTRESKKLCGWYLSSTHIFACFSLNCINVNQKDLYIHINPKWMYKYALRILWLHNSKYDKHWLLKPNQKNRYFKNRKRGNTEM